MAKKITDAVVQRAQERGINLSQDDDNGAWHAAYLHAGQEYSLDDNDPEALLDDMEALIEALENDDIYDVNYNSDVERYVVVVNGGGTHSDAVLRKAFALAKEEVLGKVKAEEAAAAAKAAAEAKAKAPKAATKPKAAKPTSPPVGIAEPPVARTQQIFPEHIAQALADVTIAMANLMKACGVHAHKAVDQSGLNAAKGNGEIVDELPEFNEPVTEEVVTPPKPKRGFATKKV
jgi:hypothetical protein